MAVIREGKIPNQKRDGDLPFPKVFIPGEENSPCLARFIQEIHENKDLYAAQLHSHGALLFRGFPIHNAKDFNEFVEAFEWEELPYQGRAPRSHVLGKVWTANEGSLNSEIFFHHEMSAGKKFPSKVFFYCEVAPPQGCGQTSVLQSHIVTAHMEKLFPDFVETMREKGLIHSQILSNGGCLENIVGSSWQAYFNTDNPQVAEKRAELDGWRLEWRGDEGVEMIRGSFQGLKDFEGYQGKRMWFNHIPWAMCEAAKAFTKLRLGDGSQIPEDVAEESKRFMNEQCVDIEWERGDVMLVDNLAVMHARRPSLPPRHILIAMSE